MPNHPAANHDRNESSSTKQIAVGVGIILLVMLVTCGIRLSLGISGFIGEVLAFFAGILSTPFLLEISFIIIGFIIVIALNAYSREKDGDEFVTRDDLDSREK